MSFICRNIPNCFSTSWLWFCLFAPHSAPSSKETKQSRNGSLSLHQAKSQYLPLLSYFRFLLSPPPRFSSHSRIYWHVNEEKSYNSSYFQIQCVGHGKKPKNTSVQPFASHRNGLRNGSTLLGLTQKFDAFYGNKINRWNGPRNTLE